MPDIFLSYAREDQAIARRFAQGFEREGLSVWWDQSLHPGEAFDQVTEQALAEARAVTVLWSKASVSSRWVRAEATQASANNRLLPVMIEPCTRPIMFELTHTADLSQWKGNTDDPAWRSFVASVRHFVQRRASGATTSVPALAVEPATHGQGNGASRWTPLHAVAAIIASGRSFLRRFGVGLAFALAGAAIAGTLALNLRPSVVPEVSRLPLGLDIAGSIRTPAVSRDGRRMVFQANNQLYLRRLDQDGLTLIPGTEGGHDPFFSPEGTSVAFFTNAGLTMVDLDGGVPRLRANVTQRVGSFGTWDDQNRIYFGSYNASGIYRVAAGGGVPEEFATRGEYQDLDYPDVLPGGDWVLFSAKVEASTWDTANIVAQNATTGDRRKVLEGGYFARYLRSGHLVFMREGTLYAVAFDARRLRLRGDPVPVEPGVFSGIGNEGAAFAVAGNGTLVYARGKTVDPFTQSHVVRVDRAGESKRVSKELRDYSNPRPSPDGTQIAVEVKDANGGVHIWIINVVTGAERRLTLEGDTNRFPVWTANGREILYVSRWGKDHSIRRQAAFSSTAAIHVLDVTGQAVLTEVHDHTLLYYDKGNGGLLDIFTFDLDAGGTPQPVLATADTDSGGRLSSDMAWLLYVAVPGAGPDANKNMVYVRPYSNIAAGAPREVSQGSGHSAKWSATGDEIFYIGPSVAGGGIFMWSASVDRTPTTITVTGRKPLFPYRFRLGGTGPRYDVMGSYFIAVEADTPNPATSASGSPERGSDQQRFNIVLNWGEVLKKLAPAE